LSGQDGKIEFTSFFDTLTIEELATIMTNAQTLDEIGQYEEAASWYDIAIKKNPLDIVAWYNKGNVLDNMGKLKESIFCYDKVLEIIPNDIVLRLGLLKYEFASTAKTFCCLMARRLFHS